jgi:hypothetical protein
MNGAALIVTAAATLLVLAAVAVVATVYVRRRRGFLARARTVPAVVTGIRQAVFGMGRNPSYFARVSFTAETGMPVTTEVRLYNIGVAPRLGRGLPAVRPGMRIWVDYDPAAPATAEINTQAIPEASRPPGRPNAVLMAGVFGGVVMAVLVVGGLLMVIGTP